MNKLYKYSVYAMQPHYDVFRGAWHHTLRNLGRHCELISIFLSYK